MTKNITLSIPDEIFLKMGKLQEVNWSAVAREAIEAYIERRDSPDLEPIIERLTKEKSKEYTAGIKKATEIATTASYANFDMIFVRYQEEVEKALAEEKDRRPKPGMMVSQDVYTMYGIPAVNLSHEKHQRLMKEVVVDEGHLKSRHMTMEFIRGLWDGLWEWKEKIDKLKV
ncbi:MAG: hypothetical protein KGI10_08775 [Thaumarchaeota archaeon]|nr:hypothetical protein [Nitrososphaerota archaeon]